MNARLLFLPGILATALLCGCVSNGDGGKEGGQSSAPPTEWQAWAEWVEERHSAGDDQGHGPDVGSDEWAHAIDHQLGISDDAGHGPDIKSAEWRHAVESKLAD